MIALSEVTMVWGNRSKITEESFRQQVYARARETMRGDQIELIRGIRYLPYWWVKGQIQVFWEPDISRQTVGLIVDAVDQRTRETTGLTFTFKLYEDHPSVREQIAEATVEGQIDELRLFSHMASEYLRNIHCGGQQHADIYITAKPLMSTDAWGAACFKHGAMVFCLPKQRSKSSDFLYRVALHEANHLLGMECHCDDHQHVIGLPYSPTCNMHDSCAYSELCPKCRAHIRWWWQGVLDEAQEVFSS